MDAQRRAGRDAVHAAVVQQVDASQQVFGERSHVVAAETVGSGVGDGLVGSRRIEANSAVAGGNPQLVLVVEQQAANPSGCSVRREKSLESAAGIAQEGSGPKPIQSAPARSSVKAVMLSVEGTPSVSENRVQRLLAGSQWPRAAARVGPAEDARTSMAAQIPPLRSS